MISHQPLSVALLSFIVLFIIQPITGRCPAAGVFPHDKASSCLAFFIAPGGRSVPLDLDQLYQNKPLGGKKKLVKSLAKQVKFEFQAVAQQYRLDVISVAQEPVGKVVVRK